MTDHVPDDVLSPPPPFAEGLPQTAREFYPKAIEDIQRIIDALKAQEAPKAIIDKMERQKAMTEELFKTIPEDELDKPYDWDKAFAEPEVVDFGLDDHTETFPCASCEKDLMGVPVDDYGILICPHCGHREAV